jgi:hypothetical protein
VDEHPVRRHLVGLAAELAYVGVDVAPTGLERLPPRLARAGAGDQVAVASIACAISFTKRAA